MYKYVSINRIFAKLIRDIGSDFSEDDVIEWTGEALEFLQTPRSSEETVAFIEVRNHQCEIPPGTHSIIQIAKNTRHTTLVQNPYCPADIIMSMPSVQDPEPSIPVALDCNGQPLNAYDLAYYRPYFDLKAEYLGWTGSSTYREYVPVRLSTNSFFDSLVCKDGDYHQRYSDYQLPEYTIINGEILRFSFKEGYIAIAYLKQKLDPVTGYPMIPDSISHTTAIVKYITMKVQEKQYYAGREGAAGRLAKAEADWQWYCGQATSQDMMIQGVDELQNFLDQRRYILPREHYYNFFGKLSKPEDRIWNDPNHRNRYGLIFHG